MDRHILVLPHEVLHMILVQLDPVDVAKISATCRSIKEFIDTNELLSQELYLQYFDDPRCTSNTIPNWNTALKDCIFVRQLLQSENEELKTSHMDDIAETVDHLVHTSDPRKNAKNQSANINFLRTHLANPHNGRLLSASSLYQWAAVEAWRHHPACPHFNTSAPADMEITVIEERGEADVQEDIAALTMPRPASGYVRPRSYHRMTNGHTARDAPRSVPLSLASPEEARRRQLSAKLHCLYGAPMQYVHRASSNSQRYTLRSDTAPIHPYARSKVYDMRQHTPESFWGPFMSDGSQEVDWEKMEAIMVILDYNLREYQRTRFIPDATDRWGVWQEPFEGVGPHSFVSPQTSMPMEPSLPLEAQDPYNITGTWLRIVCFLDYTELFDFNFIGDSPRAGEFRPALDTEEATRLIVMKVRVTRVEKPGPFDGQQGPVVYFKGSSSALPRVWNANANFGIHGNVRFTPQGEIRWTSMSIFEGEERWKSECIQVGGIQSARGVFGFWFDKGYDQHGPAGPTAFWKASDGIELDSAKFPRSVGGETHPVHGMHMPLY